MHRQVGIPGTYDYLCLENYREKLAPGYMKAQKNLRTLLNVAKSRGIKV